MLLVDCCIAFIIFYDFCMSSVTIINACICFYFFKLVYMFIYNSNTFSIDRFSKFENIIF